MRFGIPAALAAALVLAFAPMAQAAYRLAPYKDDLFDYPGVIESGFGGDYVKVDYVESRDLYERDVVPEKQTKPQYLDMSVTASQRDMVAKEGRVSVKYIAVGAVVAAAVLLGVFLFGRSRGRKKTTIVEVRRF